MTKGKAEYSAVAGPPLCGALDIYIDKLELRFAILRPFSARGRARPQTLSKTGHVGSKMGYAVSKKGYAGSKTPPKRFLDASWVSLGRHLGRRGR